MHGLGVDVSGQRSETLGRHLGEPFDRVVTVRDDANEAFPNFPNATARLPPVAAGPFVGGWPRRGASGS